MSGELSHLPMETTAADFLARMLTEESRLTRALELIRRMIPIYEKLVDEIPVPRTVTAAPASAAIVEQPPAPATIASGEPPKAVDKRLFYTERNDIIRREWPKGTPADEILTMLHALPGRKIDLKRVAIQAAGIGVRRPVSQPNPWLHADAIAAVTPPRTAAPPAPPPPPAPKPAAPQPKSRMEALMIVSKAIAPSPDSVPADFEQVRRWADQRGLTFSSWDDLPSVNNRRERLDLPRFCRAFVSKGRFG